MAADDVTRKLSLLAPSLLGMEVLWDFAGVKKVGPIPLGHHVLWVSFLVPSLT